MKRSIAVVACVVFPALACAAETETTVTLNLVNGQGVGATVGTVRIVETPYGLAFYPNLKGLPPGLHGFHVHQNPSCEPAEKDGTAIAALAAGGHFDPQATKHHGEPWGDGHLGDLPALYVAADGSASNPVLAPRVKKLSEVANRSLMLHAGGDNHSDQPAALGGGGARVVCGLIGG